MQECSGKCSRKSGKKLQFQDPYYWTFSCNTNCGVSVPQRLGKLNSFCKAVPSLQEEKQPIEKVQPKASIVQALSTLYYGFELPGVRSVILLFLLNNYVGTFHPFFLQMQ